MGPTMNPTHNPTKNPSITPTKLPTMIPSVSPTSNPSFFPTNNPSKHPTKSPLNEGGIVGIETTIISTMKSMDNIKQNNDFKVDDFFGQYLIVSIVSIVLIFFMMIAFYLCICRKKRKKISTDLLSTVETQNVQKDTDEIIETMPETEGAILQMHVVSTPALPQKTNMETNISTQSEDDS